MKACVKRAAANTSRSNDLPTNTIDAGYKGGHCEVKLAKPLPSRKSLAALKYATESGLNPRPCGAVENNNKIPNAAATKAHIKGITQLTGRAIIVFT